jgi:hypothetical protein
MLFDVCIYNRERIGDPHKVLDAVDIQWYGIEYGSLSTINQKISLCSSSVDVH